MLRRRFWRLLKKYNSSLHLMKKKDRWNEESMSRVHVTSMWRSTPSESVDSRKHENWPGIGCEGLSSSRTFRYWSHCRISVSRQNSFLSSNCERNSQIRNRNVRNHFSWKRWAQSCRETCYEGKAATFACCDIVSCFYSKSIQKDSVKIVLQCQKPWSDHFDKIY